MGTFGLRTGRVDGDHLFQLFLKFMIVVGFIFDLSVSKPSPPGDSVVSIHDKSLS